MTVGELKKYLNKVTDDFEINFVCDVTDENDHFMNLCNMSDISIDISYSEKTIGIFGSIQ